MSPAKTQAVWLYGSHARGDADALSDVDVLVVSESSDEPVSIDCIDLPSRQLSVTRYTWTEIDGMVDAGSLFLRHLQMEGQPASETLLAKGRLDSSLARLGPYRMARRDVRGFEEVLSDVKKVTRLRWRACLRVGDSRHSDPSRLYSRLRAGRSAVFLQNGASEACL